MADESRTCSSEGQADPHPGSARFPEHLAGFRQHNGRRLWMDASRAIPCVSGKARLESKSRLQGIHAARMNKKASQKASCTPTSLWRRWLLAASLFAFLSVFTTALTHHHEHKNGVLDCPVCHVVDHQSLDSQLPSPLIGIGLLLFYFYSLPTISRGRRSRAFLPRPFSQAPPLCCR